MFLKLGGYDEQNADSCSGERVARWLFRCANSNRCNTNAGANQYSGSCLHVN